MSKESLLEQYAGVDDVSKRLKIHPESVRRLIRQGKLPAIKFGNKWLVERATLEQFGIQLTYYSGSLRAIIVSLGGLRI
jgi:excisionase family DNA binding protein